MSVESNKAAVRAHFDAVERCDRAGLLALFRPDLRWSVPKGAIAQPDYDNNYVFVFELLGGKIAEIREHLDTRTAAQVFGA